MVTVTLTTLNLCSCPCSCCPHQITCHMQNTKTSQNIRNLLQYWSERHVLVDVVRGGGRHLENQITNHTYSLNAIQFNTMQCINTINTIIRWPKWPLNWSWLWENNNIDPCWNLSTDHRPASPGTKCYGDTGHCPRPRHLWSVPPASTITTI